MTLNYFKVSVDAIDRKRYVFPTLIICRISLGVCEWMIGDEVYHLEEGDIVFLNNITSREIIKKTNGELLIEIFEFLPYELNVDPKTLNAFYYRKPLIIRGEHSECYNDILTLIAKKYNNEVNDEFNKHLILAMFELIEEKPDRYIDYNFSQIAFKVSDYLWNNYYKDLMVPDIAKCFCVSKSYLENIFKKVHGISVAEFLNRIRVYNVNKKLESDNESSVLDIALSCGFNSSSGFYKAYNKINGEAPRRK